MDKNAIWKWLILTALVAFALAVVIPPLDKKDDKGVVVRPGKVRLGLDLKGGMSFTVRIDEARLRDIVRDRSPGITEDDIKAEVRKTMEGSQDRTLEVMRNRVDALGISEPVIFPGENNRIVIQLPGVDDEKRKEAEKNIESLAYLEFRMVHANNDKLVGDLLDKNLVPEGYRIVTIDGRPYYKADKDRAKLMASSEYRSKLSRFHVPSAEYEFLLQKDRKQNQDVYRPAFVSRRCEVSGDNLADASIDYRSVGEPVVNLKFDARGAKKFGRVTADYAPGGARNASPNTYRQLAIVLDNTLYSAPVIREAIYGGKAEISGSFTLQEATFLSNVLRAGSLPAPVEIVERRFVSPTLGEDSIRSGGKSVLIAGALVMGFMLLYYRMSGLVANIALLLNLIMLPLGMIATAGFLGVFTRDSQGGGAFLLPVLTLPGIAGIVLTIGMAVDANVLIFERIREEQASGKRLWSAVQAGFERALLAITDANLTTIITGVILFILGSGPVRGFAVTLCGGILVNLYTAVFVSKMVFGVYAAKRPNASLKMMKVIGVPSVDWVSKRNVAVLLSVVVIAGSWGVMTVRGLRNPSSIFAVDFTGGSSATFSFTKRESVQALRDALSAAGIGEANIQYQKEVDVVTEYLTVTTAPNLIENRKPSDVVDSVLREKFPASGYAVTQVNDVGPQIGSELKRRAMWALIWGLVGICVYVSWRFELPFAVGAIVALVHDVLVTIGIFTLFGRQISLTVVAALMTIIGYSVNDTIVIFDRVRENLRLIHDKSLKDICNLSMNQTMSRTILTSLTAIISVVVLLIFGGGAAADFALAMLIGMLAGVYSTVYIATPVVLAWYRNRRPDLGRVGKVT